MTSRQYPQNTITRTLLHSSIPALLLSCLLTLSTPTRAAGMAGMHMPRTVNAFEVDELETRGSSDHSVKAGGWIGIELTRVTLSGEIHHHEGDTDDEITLGIQRAISPFWDAGLVLRSTDANNLPGFRLTGTSWYFIHLDTEFFWDNEADSLLLDLHAEHELPLSRQWMFLSSFELETRLSGDSHRNTEWGFRFVREHPNRFGFYGGVVARKETSEPPATQLVVGFRYWM